MERSITNDVQKFGEQLSELSLSLSWLKIVVTD